MLGFGGINSGGNVGNLSNSKNAPTSSSWSTLRKFKVLRFITQYVTQPAVSIFYFLKQNAPVLGYLAAFSHLYIANTGLRVLFLAGTLFFTWTSFLGTHGREIWARMGKINKVFKALIFIAIFVGMLVGFWGTLSLNRPSLSEKDAVAFSQGLSGVLSKPLPTTRVNLVDI